MIRRWFDAVPEAALFTSVLVIARIVPVDTPIARRFGAFAKARTYPVIGGLLAATALERDLVLVTRNTEDDAGTAVRVLNPFISKRTKRM